MIHASPFFESILTGEWAETTDLNNTSSPSSSSASSTQEQSSPHQPQLDQLYPTTTTTTTTNDQLSDFNSTTNDDPSIQPEDEPAAILPSSAHSQPLTLLRPSIIPNTSNANRIEARILLKEERPASFQDLLMFVYPHLECVCTWHNASDLMTMSQKFDMPLLQRHVLNFLLSSVAGKPIEAMKIAEEHQLSELYRESSRFLLDNWQGWDHKELERLSSQTLLKLEKRRTWFLERLLKLGLVNSSRDYVCPPSCPDPQHCTKLVDDKWRSAWAASFKFGPPQPSSVYRALRCLEPSLHSPALLLPHTSCQQHALRFFADLFDRMFSQFTPRGPGGGGPGGGGGGGVVGPNGAATGIGAVAVSQTGSSSSTANPLMGSIEATQQPPGLPYYLASSVGTPTPSIPSSSNTTGLNLGSTGLTTPNNNNNNHHHPAATGSSSSSNTTTTATTTNAAGGVGGGLHLTTGTISASSHPLLLLQNSEKNFRKAKYFLHVELFESVEKNRKRID
ncbi:hypothetical protein PGT21_029388 [Puccinia graminis f. sp. tritici]|uniref:BTB domain-containing protein n=1 Tax=Puccinia graminis f. sp. tritici TaxID=56615 RepID=A0A5B0M4U5_PUCGR|nr:hypothetical protein PGT21_029388 [Puccinia graminis f. sp. tritici]